MAPYTISGKSERFHLLLNGPAADEFCPVPRHQLRHHHGLGSGLDGNLKCNHLIQEGLNGRLCFLELWPESSGNGLRVLRAEPAVVPHEGEVPLEAAVDLGELATQDLAQLPKLGLDFLGLFLLPARPAGAAKHPREKVLDLLDAVVDGELAKDPVVDAVGEVGAVPEDVLEEQAVDLRHLEAAVGVRCHLEEGDRLHEAAVGDVAGRLDLLLKVHPEVRDELNDALRHLHGLDSIAADLLELLKRQRHLGGEVRAPAGPIGAARLGEELREATGAHLLHLSADEEAVVQGIELLALGELVGGRDHADEGHLAPRAPVVEEPLVEDREKGVQDGRVGLEDLVDEGDVGAREVPADLADVLVLLEGAHRQRPKELLGDGEPREEALEVGAAGQLTEAAPELRLGRPRRSEVEDVLPAERREEQEPHLGVALDEAALHDLHSLLERGAGARVEAAPLGGALVVALGGGRDVLDDGLHVRLRRLPEGARLRIDFLVSIR
mmetsp:Transcript_9521/g.22922  ORF Transcript_9521/g.22922 Transcript_9521/m.22922 type:complete len:496 (-) Transcript_9521:302-1789(-)